MDKPNEIMTIEQLVQALSTGAYKIVPREPSPAMLNDKYKAPMQDQRAWWLAMYDRAETILLKP